MLQLLLFTYFTTNKKSNENTFKNLKVVGQFIERITFTFVLTLAICIKVDERFYVRHNQSKTGMSKSIYKVKRYISLIHRTLNTHIATMFIYGNNLFGIQHFIKRSFFSKYYKCFTPGLE